MRRNAQTPEDMDANQDNKPDFDEFCAMVRQRYRATTRKTSCGRDCRVDADGSGLIDMNEYIRFSLRDALSRSAQRVIDLFRKWDEDGNGTIEEGVPSRALGFDFANAGEIDMVFDDLTWTATAHSTTRS